MQTRSQTTSKLLSEFKILITSIPNTKGLPRAKAMYEFYIYMDNNFSLLFSVMKKSHPNWFEGMRVALNRCKQNLEDGETSRIEYLEEKERKHMALLVLKLANKVK